MADQSGARGCWWNAMGLMRACFRSMIVAFETIAGAVSSYYSSARFSVFANWSFLTSKVASPFRSVFKKKPLKFLAGFAVFSFLMVVEMRFMGKILRVRKAPTVSEAGGRARQFLRFARATMMFWTLLWGKGLGFGPYFTKAVPIGSSNGSQVSGFHFMDGEKKR